MALWYDTGHTGLMTTRLVPVELDGETVWIEAIVPPGTEPTSSAAEKVLTAFDAAETVMTDLAVRVVDAMRQMSEKSARPDQIEVEFGLSVSTTGGIIVASGTVEATLKVKLTYAPRPAEGSAP